MSFQESRSSFQVFLLDSDKLRRESVLQIMQRADFKPEVFEHEDHLLETAKRSPPHIVLLHYDSTGFSGDAFLQRAQKFLPETRFLVLCEHKSVSAAMTLHKRGAYDVIAFPTPTSSHFIGRIDHAVETDYYKFLSEQLETEVSDLKSQLRESESLRQSQAGELSVHKEYQTAGPLVDRHVELEAKWLKLNQWLDKLTKCSTVDECLEHLLFSLAESRNNTPGLYLKYIPTFRTLVVAQSYQLERRKVRGLGIDLKKETEKHSQELLQNPKELSALTAMMKDVLNCEKFFPLTLKVGVQTLGLLILFDTDTPWSQEDELKKALTLQMCSKIILQKRLHMERIKDETTDVLDRHNFLVRISEEVTRSRRTRLPVAMVVCSIDRFDVLTQQLDKDDLDLLLKMVAQILAENSRVNDLVGRISTDEFGIILPHTGRRGGAIKAERLRRILQSADFSEAIESSPRITMSLGVSEYPSLCADADDLLKTADDALFQVRRTGENRVCLANLPKNFTPDFSVQDV